MGTEAEKTWSTSNLFAFWTGDNEMSPARRACFETLSNSELPVTLIAPHNLPEWILPDKPLHPAYPYLSAVHRSDYLRPYFMHHHGGGYADIKQTTRSWLPALAKLKQSPQSFGVGYREKSAKGVANFHRHRLMGQSYYLTEPTNPLANMLRYRFLRANWRSLMGMCAYVFQPDTEFTREWLSIVEKRLDLLLPHLKTNPATSPRQADDTPGAAGAVPYPMPWSFICADVIHPLCFKHRKRLLLDLPPPSFNNYL